MSRQGLVWRASLDGGPRGAGGEICVRFVRGGERCASVLHRVVVVVVGGSRTCREKPVAEDLLRVRTRHVPHDRVAVGPGHVELRQVVHLEAVHEGHDLVVTAV